MAIKAIMLRRKLKDARAKLETLSAEAEKLKTREAELEAAVDEAEGDEQLAALEAEADTLENDRSANEASRSALEAEISEMEDQLRAEEEAQSTDPVTGGTPAPDGGMENERKDKNIMNIQIRNRFFGKMDIAQRSALFAQEDVKSWLGEVRSHIQEKRALANVGLTIPEVFIGMLRENIINYSKLYRHVNVRPVSGEARQLIMGSIPEGVWTDCCASLNELDLGFYGLEMDCFKVGGFFAVCNASLEDSDLDLAAELLDSIAKAVGKALDKSILYGRNTTAHMKMPQGIVSRLTQTAQPSGYPAIARPWKDLSSSNVISIPAAASGAALFAQIELASSAASDDYSSGDEMTWVMNKRTRSKLRAEALTFDSAGAIVAQVNREMPVVGGEIETLSFLPDNVLIGGYFDLYTLVERAGAKFATSEHVRFLQDQTVMKGTARYDGTPAIAEAFVAIGIGGVTPTADMTFAPDVANDPPTLSALSLGSATLSPSFSSAVINYTATTTNASNAVTATAANAADTIAITVNGASVANGASATWNTGENTVVVTVTSASNGAANTYTVTVTKS